MKHETQTIGNLGEYLATKFLKGRGFNIVEMNYRKKWGEIDIIAKKDGNLHFVEVKATVSHETSGYRPEENIRLWKKQRMTRAIRTYLLDRNISDNTDIQVDVVAINLDFLNKKAKVRWVKNVLLGE